MPTKKELEQELKVMTANYNANEKVITKMLLEKKKSFMTRVVDLENTLHDEITVLVQACIDRTGRVPEIHIEVESKVKDPESKYYQISMPVFEPSNSHTHTQATAVRKLIEYCMNVGDWRDRNQCKKWVIKKLNESSC